jgi:hypothetical protein
MEHDDWMNNEVKQEIADLQRSFGFEEREALAYWHLAEARALMVQLAIEGKDEEAAEVPASIAEHFSALYRELGLRVLQRDYPEGWTDRRI